MGKKRSPGEKRLRGLLSGDPLRVARTLRRSVWTNDPEIYETIAKSQADVVAAIGDMVLDDDATARRARLFARFTGAAGVGRTECPCLRGGAGGNPSSSRHYKVLGSKVFAGHSEMSVVCDGCGRAYSVTEDVGYHTPQYSWRATRS